MIMSPDDPDVFGGLPSDNDITPQRYREAYDSLGMVRNAMFDTSPSHEEVDKLARGLLHEMSIIARGSSPVQKYVYESFSHSFYDLKKTLPGSDKSVYMAYDRAGILVHRLNPESVAEATGNDRCDYLVEVNHLNGDLYIRDYNNKPFRDLDLTDSDERAAAIKILKMAAADVLSVALPPEDQ